MLLQRGVPTESAVTESRRSPHRIAVTNSDFRSDALYMIFLMTQCLKCKFHLISGLLDCILYLFFKINFIMNNTHVYLISLFGINIHNDEVESGIDKHN